MHIKQITISNFRSFRQQPEIHPFTSTTNCVVGRNGSGKSNLFDAIQFVLLSPRFATLRSEERQALLHEGSGSAAVNAFVEVVFDNSDNRFSLENSDEVVLRRTVGSKKDEFFLQRKRATKQEVQSFLEGAGFSKSNPYFMVQQGKIQTLCLMTDAQRLKLLQEVAGTTLYEDKKSESLLKMTENSQSIDKINSILADIDLRLNELKGEKEELTVYQTCDRTRKALEYTLYDKELRKARHILDHLEHDRTEHLQESAKLHDITKQTHDHIQEAEAQLKVKTQALKRNRVQWQNHEQDKTKAVTLKTRLDLSCKELSERVQLGEETLLNNQEELVSLDEKVTAAREKLAQTDSTIKLQQSELQELRKNRDVATRRADALYAKQGRGKEYSSKEERDKSLARQIRELETTRNEKEENLRNKQSQLASLRRTISEVKSELSKTTEDSTRRTDELQALHKSLDEKQKENYALMDVRKRNWRKLEDLEERAKTAKESLQRSVFDFRKTMPRATAMGIKALQTIVEREKIVVGQQYYGTVLENMRLKDAKHQTAVEVAAQNALFHVIVDTDATAARLMKCLESDRLGRVTFMPLNRLRLENNIRYPQSNDVTPLLDTCIEYPPQVAKAMRQVFAKKMLARNADVAAEWADKVSMDCITLDGDLCSRKGALTGGYVDRQKSRLRAFNAQREAEQTCQSIASELQEVNKKARQAEQDVTNLSQEISKVQQKQGEMARLRQITKSALDEKSAQLTSQKKQADRIETHVLPPMELEISSITGDISRCRDEIGTELSSSLSLEDRSLLQSLKNDASELKDFIAEKTETIEELRNESQKIESLLEENLLKRRRELVEVDQDDGIGLVATSSKALLEERRRELVDRVEQFDKATKEVDEVNTKLGECRELDEELKTDLRAAKNSLEKLKGQDMKNSKLLDEASERSEKLMSKKSMNIGKRDSYMRKIQELGSLPPPSELQNYQKKSIPELEKELERVNKKLKKYSHVNKKAFDQYVNFSEQRESLINRKEELDKGAEKVKELVESLDRKKDEAINRTFRGVSKHFSEVFKELVPLGSGELIMRSGLDDNEADTDNEAEDAKTDISVGEKHGVSTLDVSLYRGVGIKVRFSEVGENFIMSQLSGGQKALVALALIFAIQRCDPAPFYIFDELDQALDSTYRQAVANLIQSQANNSESPTQFITSTFRPELVSIAKNCYGISHQNKVSSVHHMSKSDALRFIANLMSEEEAVQEISSVTTKSSRKRKASSIGARDLLEGEGHPAAELVAVDGGIQGENESV